MKYVLGIDQSTQGTKALLFDDKGNLLCRTDKPHKQYYRNQKETDLYHETPSLWEILCRSDVVCIL